MDGVTARPSALEVGDPVRSEIGHASVPFSASFRGSLWWVVGATDRDAGVGHFALLLLVFAVAVATLAFVIEPLVRAQGRDASRARP